MFVVACLFDQRGHRSVYGAFLVCPVVLLFDPNVVNVPFESKPIHQNLRRVCHWIGFFIWRLRIIPQNDSRKSPFMSGHCRDFSHDGVFVFLWICHKTILFFNGTASCRLLSFVSTMGRFLWAQYDYVFVGIRLWTFMNLGNCYFETDKSAIERSKGIKYIDFGSRCIGRLKWFILLRQGCRTQKQQSTLK